MWHAAALLSAAFAAVVAGTAVTLGSATCFASDGTCPVLARALDELEAAQDADGAFTALAPYLGTAFISQYALFAQWFGAEGAFAAEFSRTRLQHEELLRRLLREQRDDGGWVFVLDAHAPGSELSATILNYWALKAVLGQRTDAPHMAAARRFVLGRGGLRAADAMTKWMLALFGAIEWADLPWLPKMPLLAAEWVRSQVAQWVWPHLLPMVTLRGSLATLTPAAEFLLPELCTGRPCPAAAAASRLAQPAAYDADELQQLVDLMRQLQQPRGSFGAYTVASLWSVAAFAHFLRVAPDDARAPALHAAATRVVSFCETLYFDSGPVSYRGALDDGRAWDTILAGLALAEGGRTAAAERAAAFVASMQVPLGGVPYGRDFEYAPDIDDTGVSLVLWARVAARQRGGDGASSGLDDASARATAWLVSMQSASGGFAAFDRDKEGHWLVGVAAGAFADSAALWDPACADVTGHVLEGLVEAGVRRDDPAVAAAAAFLQGTQRADGSWWGRWGINTIYATSAALVGLHAADARAGATVERGARYLLGRQNGDGGFGETPLSYSDRALEGVGVSTPTQTAWGLLGLVAAALALGPAHALDAALLGAAGRAVAHLEAAYNATTGWTDGSVVGTGHAEQRSAFRGLMLQYPVYAKAFPVMALSRYAGLLERRRVDAAAHARAPQPPLDRRETSQPTRQHAAPAGELDPDPGWDELLERTALVPTLMQLLISSALVRAAIVAVGVAQLAVLAHRLTGIGWGSVLARVAWRSRDPTYAGGMGATSKSGGIGKKGVVR